MTAIQASAASDGTLTYLITGAPACLPPVLKRDLLRAWDDARSAAIRRDASQRRAFRFQHENGATTDLALTDRDARCWAGAVDRITSIASPYGLSICLRLLALIHLLGQASWVRPFMTLRPGGTDLHPDLLRLAAEAKLTDDGRFDEGAFRARLTLAGLPAP